MLRAKKNLPSCRRPGQCQRREEADGGERQTEEWHWGTKKTAAGKREAEGRYVEFGSQQRLPSQIECLFVFKKTLMLLSFLGIEALVWHRNFWCQLLLIKALFDSTISDNILCLLASAHYNQIFFFVFIISSHSASRVPVRVMGSTCLSAIVCLTYVDIQEQTAQIINTHLMFSRKTPQE